MTQAAPALYVGEVVHTRLRPVEHKLRYRVFSVLFDVERLTERNTGTRLFSYNRANLLSLHDRDHGDGSPLREYLAGIAARTPGGEAVQRFLMLCYPRILGYAFNPLTVYYGLDAGGRIRLLVYEVNNTFGERMTYVVPAEADENGVVAQTCGKQLHVSPFNEATGTYGFRVAVPDRELTVGVSLRTTDGPVMKAHFRGSRRPLTDRELLTALALTGWMTVRVTAGIHVEAARLWLKGLRPVPRKRATAKVRIADRPQEQA